MSKLYIIGETNCRGHVSRIKFSVEVDKVIADLNAAKLVLNNDEELDKLFDDIGDEYGFDESHAIYTLIQNDYVGVSNEEYINDNIRKIENNESIQAETEESIYAFANSKEKALLAFSNIDESDW